MTSETRGVEVRVHGIGNHQAFSALGSPINAQGKRVLGGRRTEVVREDLEPAHRVWFVAWTRTARALNGPGWYFAVPFTLCNTAGHMKPTRSGLGADGSSRQSLAHQVVVAGFALLLTLGAYLWSVTLAETLTYRLFSDSNVTEIAPTLVVAAIWIGGIGVRYLLGSICKRSRGRTLAAEIESSRSLALLHVLVVAVATILILVVRPGQSTIDPDSPCLLGSDGAPCLIFMADWTVIVAAITIAAASILAIVLAGVSAIGDDKDWSEQPADPWLGTGLCLIAAGLLLHIGASVLQLIIDWATNYLTAQNSLWEIQHEGPYQAMLRAYDYKEMPFSGRDAFTTLLSPAVWFIVAAIAWSAFRRLYLAIKRCLSREDPGRNNVAPIHSHAGKLRRSDFTGSFVRSKRRPT